MGWTKTHRPKGWTDRDWFKRELSGGQNIVECATVGSVFYAAVAWPHTGETVALVCLTQRFPKSDYNYGWKDMDETMLPYSYDCPARVLDALTPTENENANNWRAACRAVLARKARRPKIGETIRLAAPVNFSFGPAQQLTRVSLPGKRNVYRTETGRLVRFPRLEHYEFTMV